MYICCVSDFIYFPKLAMLGRFCCQFRFAFRFFCFGLKICFQIVLLILFLYARKYLFLEYFLVKHKDCHSLMISEPKENDNHVAHQRLRFEFFDITVLRMSWCQWSWFYCFNYLLLICLIDRCMEVLVGHNGAHIFFPNDSVTYFHVQTLCHL